MPGLPNKGPARTTRSQSPRGDRPSPLAAPHALYSYRGFSKDSL